MKNKTIIASKRGGLYRDIYRHKWFYLMLVPGLITLLIFNYIPMYGILMAFQDYDIVRGIQGSDWVGFGNFKEMFQSDGFLQVLRNSILISFYRIAWGFPVPILLALMLNEVRRVKVKKTIQTIVYLPHFVSWVVITGMVQQFLSPSGLINSMTAMFGMEPVAFLQKPEYFRTIIVVTDIWKEAGWSTIMYLAALAGIDPALYEAAMIDGASRLKMIRYITFPSILSTVVVLLILRMGSVLRNGFEQIFLLQNSLVLEVSDVFETYTYSLGLIDGNYGQATAVGVVQSVVGLVLTLTVNKLARKFSDGGALW